MNFTPSKYQQALFDFAEHGKGSACVKAVAGSGKSTSIRHMIMRLPEDASIVVLAFNASIVKEMLEKVTELSVEYGKNFPKLQVKTFHSLGLGAINRFLNRRTNAEANKSRTLFRNGFKPDLDDYCEFVCKLVGLAKGQGLGVLTPNTDDEWYKIINHHDLELDTDDGDEATAVKLARELLELSNKSAKEDGFIDFDDMLYLPLLWKLKLFTNDWVIIDEAQDTNPARRALAKLALRPGGRLVAVGDDRQAIYGFTGASHDAMDLIRAEFSCTELPLTVSYRCAKSVVAKAKRLVPYIEAFEGAPEGSVTVQPLSKALASFTAHDVILCRNTAPLISLAYALISLDVGCTVLGRDIATGLTNLIKKMHAKGIDQLMDKLEAYREREVAKFMAKGQEQKAEAVEDRVACITVVVAHLSENDRTVPALIAKLNSIFSDSNGVLTLCTAHKSKGREWETVGILAPELMPSKYARQTWQQLQEENLMYVAWTRAKTNLIFLDGPVSSVTRAS